MEFSESYSREYRKVAYDAYSQGFEDRNNDMGVVLVFAIFLSYFAMLMLGIGYSSEGALKDVLLIVTPFIVTIVWVLIVKLFDR